MIKKVIIFFIVVLILLFASNLDARYGDVDYIRHFKMSFFMTEVGLFDATFILKVKEKIGITKKQERTIEDVMLSYRESCIKNSADIKIRELRLASYINSEKIDRKLIEKTIRDISRKKTNSIVNYMNYLFNLSEILTSEQIEILKTIRDEIKKQYEEKKKKRWERYKKKERAHSDIKDKNK